MPKARTYIRKGIIQEMIQKCNYKCPFCHRNFFLTYLTHYVDSNRENNACDNRLLLCPECYSHKDNFSVHEILKYIDKKKRRNFCVRCNKPFISIHHIDGNPLNNEMDNLVPLCRGCHIEYDLKISEEDKNKIKKLRDEWYDYCKYELDF